MPENAPKSPMRPTNVPNPRLISNLSHYYRHPSSMLSDVF